jgi:hypothetical protein
MPFLFGPLSSRLVCAAPGDAGLSDRKEIDRTQPLSVFMKGLFDFIAGGDMTGKNQPSVN